MINEFKIYKQSLSKLSEDQKLLINTINAHSFNVAQFDSDFKSALLGSDVLIPDGVSIVLALMLLNKERIKKIAGADLFYYEMDRLERIGGKCFFLGSTEENLMKIINNAKEEYPHVDIVTYSPPFKPEFSAEDNAGMIELINAYQPDVLFVGMTAPKQEKWAYRHFDKLQVGHICCIGAVFDFYAGTISRAPKWMVRMGMEWLYRLIMEPPRMWRRYLIGNTKFSFAIIKEKFRTKHKSSAIKNERIVNLTSNK